VLASPLVLFPLQPRGLSSALHELPASPGIFIYTKSTEKVNIWTRIRKVLGSNLGGNAAYSDWGFDQLYSVFSEKLQGKDSIRPAPFSSIFLNLSYIYRHIPPTQSSYWQKRVYIYIYISVLSSAVAFKSFFFFACPPKCNLASNRYHLKLLVYKEWCLLGCYTRATRCNIPEDTILHSHSREYLKSYILVYN
jgi:hypothetical protein